MCKLHSRFRKHIKHGDAFWWFGGVQVIQPGHRVDDSKHDGCFDPIIDEVEVSQTNWKRCKYIKSTSTPMTCHKPLTLFQQTYPEPSQRGASAASCQLGGWGCTWSGKRRPLRQWFPNGPGPAGWYSTSPFLFGSGWTYWPAEDSELITTRNELHPQEHF